MSAMSGSGSALEVIPVPAHGAEDVVVATSGPDEGCVFTGTGDGSIWRISPDGQKVDRVADTGGHPLGIELHPDGRLLVSHAMIGAVSMAASRGATSRASNANGRSSALA